VFKLLPGVYSVVGTYRSAPPQNITVSASECDVILNFGSSSPPPLGHILIEAYYTGNESGGDYLSHPVQASVTVVGAELHNGTTTTSYYDPLIFTVAPGVYSVFGTYNPAPPQNITVEVAAGSDSYALFVFGDAPLRPPP
jgi:hypothetical protein